MSQSSHSWRELNARLQKASEVECLQMLNDELHGPARLKWLMRIRGRFKVLRDERENRELEQRWSERHGKKTA